MAVKGIDLSYSNAVKNYAALKASGIEFAILRTGYGSDYPGQQDSRFEKHVAGCEAAGIPWGAYHYGYALNRQGGIDEAKHCLRLLAGRKPVYGVWYDMEADCTLGGDLAGAADGFCSTIEAAGLYAGVYANYNWFSNYLTDPVFDKYDRWVAQYNSVCELQKPYGIWQFTDKLYIDGVQLDCDWAYKDYPALTGGKSTVSTKSRVLATQENHITNPFGNGHGGVDLGWQTTQTDGVLAHSEGKVVFCQTGQSNNPGSTGNASYGNCVKLAHPNGYYTLYAHLSEVSVAYGQTVAMGQQIGRMGSTGNSYGNHLHFEVRNQQDTRIDPAPYIAADLPGLVTVPTQKEEKKVDLDEFKRLWNEMRKQLQDNDASGYSEEARKWAVDSGLVVGSTTGEFNGMWEDLLTREQLVTVLYRFAKIAGLV